ncbi:TonB-linked outer membrane protein, SusC/RagA family [Dyadobacter koreensis]|uniref:TonB-linked outer membrane protein, SusC/RagA family n=1 Tax=Dyadobacter koreensis TaxID=408657 RepID=A0A1H6QPL6_9BACT|nr:SusC/RagA family TonB-linked outer membrane protein [Dyadobacter koreensis]SEI45569.1 TonB-linked outer membrane protein, SusC/RagA family [Dyadobacter koreensis]
MRQFYFWVLFIFWIMSAAVPPLVLAQKRSGADKIYLKKSITLTKVLDKIAADYQIIFNYDTDLLAGKFLTEDITESYARNPDPLLKRLLDPYRIKFSRKNNVYILFQDQADAGKISRQSSVLPASATDLSENKTWKLKGRVFSQKGEELAGITVLLKNSQKGSVSKSTGDFFMDVPARPGTLQFSSVGFESKDIAFLNESELVITLIEDTRLLNEIIVTGYAKENRRQVTGAVFTANVEQLSVVVSTNIEQQLQGKVPGLTLITNGQPGTSSQVRVRGFGSFGGNQPLYIVDGVPTQNIQFINPGDIESFTVLKDAASASVYGARAAAGVIVLTTKKGKRSQNKLAVSYEGIYGLTYPGKGQSVLSPQQQADWSWQARKNDIFQTGGTVGPGSFNGIANGQYGSGQNPVLPDYLLVGNQTGLSASQVNLDLEKSKYNTDPAISPLYLVIPSNREGTNWYQAISRKAALTRHALGFSGGSKMSSFYIGLGYQKQEGIILSSIQERYTFRINTEFNIAKKIRFGENIQLSYLSTTGQQGSSGSFLGNSLNNNPSVSSEENDILATYRMAPIIPVYNSFGGYAGTAAPGFSNPRNPVASRISAGHNRSNTVYGFGNVYTEIDLLPNTVGRSSIGGIYFNNYNQSQSRATYENSENLANFSYAEASGYGLAWTFTNTAEFKKNFGRNQIMILTGMEALNTGAGRNINGSGINPFSTDPDYLTLGSTTSGSTRHVNSTSTRGNNFYSLFAQTRYIYDDKYIVTAVVRRDGSSQFGKDYRFGIFPAFSAGWRLSAEEFLKRSTWISDLKLRVGYGKMGNSTFLSSTNQYSLFSSNAANGYDLGATNTGVVPGYYNSQIGNPKAKWETSETLNLGVDFSAFKNKLEIVLDFWRKNTHDLLYQLPIPGVVGTRASAPFVNIASMRNQGIDLLISNKGKLAGDIRYEVTGVGSFLHNRIISIAPLVPYFAAGGTRLGTPVVRNQPGHALSSFYGYQVQGLFSSKEEVATAAVQTGAAPGRFRFKDLNNDGKIDDSDRTFLGSPIPPFTGSLTFSIKYKGVDLNTSLYTSLGNQIFNNQRWFSDFYPSFTGAAVSTRVLDSWLPTHTSTSVPIFESAANFSTNTQSNSYYVENGNYLRMQYLNLGYTFNEKLLKKISVKMLRVSVSATNLFTLTKYSGLDPAVGGFSDAVFGVDVGNYPVGRGYSLNLKVGF